MLAGDEMGEGLPRTAEPVEEAVDDRCDAVGGDEPDIALKFGAAADKDAVEADPAHQYLGDVGWPAAGCADTEQGDEAAFAGRSDRLVQRRGAADVKHGVDAAGAPFAHSFGPARIPVIHRQI